jgi:hypothetical protein
MAADAKEAQTDRTWLVTPHSFSTDMATPSWNHRG